MKTTIDASIEEIEDVLHKATECIFHLQEE
jgi:uncharacterized protein YqgV (UPF0045/DUF77 family)